ncbi:MAG: ATP-binding cassette domain-containing protein, partial [Betaproteobacteria bacterium]
MISACEAEARRNKWEVAIAILDDGGHLLMLERMDGATPFNAEVAVQKGRGAAIPAQIFDMFPVLKDMLGRRGGDLSGGQQQQLAIGRALAMRPKLLILDEPTEGIQPSIIKDIERVIRLLAQQGEMAILLVEQYY